MLPALLFVAASLAITWSANFAQATIITFNSVLEFSNGTPPDGSTPWVRATFDDHNAFGSVDVTLSAVNLTDPEFVTEWDLNLDPGLNPTALVFSAPTKVGSFTDPVISKGVNAFQADGDGEFDIEIAFDSSNGASTHFGVGESAKFTVTGIPTLNAFSFLFTSNPHGGSGPYHMATHVQATGTNDNKSGWVAPDPSSPGPITPEPASWALALMGAGGLAALLRRRRK
jgi:MYXO-CTERM domain-containing protein